MNGQWKLVIVLVCVLVVVSIFAVLTFVENNDLCTKLKDQEKLELDSGMKDIEIQKLKSSPIEAENQNIDTENITDKDLIEFL